MEKKVKRKGIINSTEEEILEFDFIRENINPKQIRDIWSFYILYIFYIFYIYIFT